MLLLGDIAPSLALSIQVGAVVVWLGFVFSLSAILRQFGNNSELVRKVVHIGTGNVLLIAWGLQIPLWLCLIAGGLFSAIAYLSYYTNILPMLNGVGRKTHGVFYYAVSITLLVALFWRIDLPQFAVVGVMVMSWGDGVAALVGQRWGKHSYSCLGNKRTLEGSLAMLGVSYLIVVLVLSLANGWLGGGSELFHSSSHHWLIALPVAAIATLFEAFSPGGTDNLTVPLSSALLCYTLNSGLTPF
ncbi:diacylglycerol/polyprenol kinase family protein [Tumidithrix elongata RA019]|uniref:Diacylglycerol/polyprenol kinase family protein n=1 Tax=Tumidithrix elongata BACA0141 TaxID=2716417 RepID=A0AAW9PUB2_9CYAN|nr:diacylglycerol/polyprenol kinase family protein [Tumidithrix elongata RA019]